MFQQDNAQHYIGIVFNISIKHPRTYYRLNSYGTLRTGEIQTHYDRRSKTNSL